MLNCVLIGTALSCSGVPMGNIYQYDNTPRYIERRAATFPRDMSIQAQYRYACDMRRANKHLYKEHTETHYCEIAYGASK